MIAEELYDCRNILVPIVGENVFYCNDMPLIKFVLFSLIEQNKSSINLLNERYDINLIDLIMDSPYYGLSIMSKIMGADNLSKLYQKIINENKSKIHLLPVVKDFLMVYKFPLVLTTNCFDILERELIQYSSFYHIKDSANIIKENNEIKLIYHIFGKAEEGYDWVYNEGTLLEFLHDFNIGTQAYGISSIRDYMSKVPRKRLLSIGSNLPDWVFRMIWYPITSEKSRQGYFIKEEQQKYDISFIDFLERIQEDKNPIPLENILRQAVDVYMQRQNIVNSIPLGMIRHNYTYDIFISHAGEDRELAEKFAQNLKEDFGLNVFIDNYINMEDTNYLDKYAENIRKSAYFMPFITSKYIEKHQLARTIENIKNSDIPHLVRETHLASVEMQRRRDEEQNIKYAIIVIAQEDITSQRVEDLATIGVLPTMLFKNRSMNTLEQCKQKNWEQFKYKLYE